MRRLALALLVALVGCGSPTQAPLDAETLDGESAARRKPFSTTGTTPAGSLDGVRYIGVSFLDGFCPAGYYVGLYKTALLSSEPVVQVHIPIPFELSVPPTGMIAATAWAGGDDTQRTDQVSFEIVHVDLPVMPLLRIAGRVTASAGAWNLDFTFDMQTEPHICI